MSCLRSQGILNLYISQLNPLNSCDLQGYHGATGLSGPKGRKGEMRTVTQKGAIVIRYMFRKQTEKYIVAVGQEPPYLCISSLLLTFFINHYSWSPFTYVSGFCNYLTNEKY